MKILKTIFNTIFLIILTLSCDKPQQEKQINNNELIQNLKIEKTNKIEIVIFPNRTSEFTIHGKTVKRVEEIKKINKLIINNVSITNVIKFKTLPDGYLAFYNNSNHLINIYFSFDKNKTLLHILDKNISKEIKLNSEGDTFFRNIYSQNINIEKN